MRYTLNGRSITEERAKALFVEADWEACGFGPQDAAKWFELAKEQSSHGYAWRDTAEGAVEGLTMRHSNEELGQ